MTQPDFVTANDVATLTGFDDAPAFLRHRARLENDQDFPLPMPLGQRRMRWRRDCVLAWVAEQGLPRRVTAQLPPIPEGPNIILLQMAKSA
jgi:predicted DNA-binding transcriptional regulator AlpA